MKRIAILCLSVLLLFLAACSDSRKEKPVNPDSTPKTLQSEKENSEQEESDMQLSQQPAISGETAGEKTLIVYFSLADIVPEGADASAHATPAVGNTESAAMEIQKQTGGDLVAIKTVQTYPVGHRECSQIAEEEMKSDARPEISTYIENVGDYSTVYIGFPIWWYQEPMAIRTFLEAYDFSGKTILPFCTTLGAGVEESEENIRTLCPDAAVQKGLTLYTGQESFKEPIEEWLSELGMINKN